MTSGRIEHRGEFALGPLLPVDGPREAGLLDEFLAPERLTLLRT